MNNVPFSTEILNNMNRIILEKDATIATLHRVIENADTEALNKLEEALGENERLKEEVRSCMNLRHEELKTSNGEIHELKKEIDQLKEQRDYNLKVSKENWQMLENIIAEKNEIIAQLSSKSATAEQIAEGEKDEVTHEKFFGENIKRVKDALFGKMQRDENSTTITVPANIPPSQPCTYPDCKCPKDKMFCAAKTFVQFGEQQTVKKLN
jgi:chromosome segregation ATPase